MKTIHVVCGRLRDKPCQQCPARFKDGQYGWMVKGCYALADETIRIVKTGGPFKTSSANRKWRKSRAKHIGKQVV